MSKAPTWAELYLRFVDPSWLPAVLVRCPAHLTRGEYRLAVRRLRKMQRSEAMEDQKKIDENRAAVAASPIGEHIMQYFAYAHLPPHLQAVSKPFGELAEHLVATLPRNPERTVALRKLLEAKDAGVRALLSKG